MNAPAPLDDYRALQEGEFSAPGDLVLEDGRRGLNRCESVSQMEPTDVGVYFRMERLPDRCSIHTHYIRDDGSGCLCGCLAKATPPPVDAGPVDLDALDQWSACLGEGNVVRLMILGLTAELRRLRASTPYTPDPEAK